MIRRIQKLQGYRIFRDFKWDGLADFGRYNLIYGWNGVGKTTLSSLFRLLQDKTPPTSGVKNWFNYAGGISNKPYHPEKSKNAHFYMLGMVFDNGQRSAVLQTLDPLLHQYESEYHYLFRNINVSSTSDSPKSLAEVYGLPNIARRLLEAFLSFRVPGRAGDLRQQLEAISGEPASKARIIRFLHTHSHMEQIGEAEHDLSILSETPAILREILALIKENDPKHYEAMIEICSG